MSSIIWRNRSLRAFGASIPVSARSACFGNDAPTSPSSARTEEVYAFWQQHVSTEVVQSKSGMHQHSILLNRRSAVTTPSTQVATPSRSQHHTAHPARCLQIIDHHSFKRRPRSPTLFSFRLSLAAKTRFTRLKSETQRQRFDSVFALEKMPNFADFSL
jgi:hypothetical protein